MSEATRRLRLIGRLASQAEHYALRDLAELQSRIDFMVQSLESIANTTYIGRPTDGTMAYIREIAKTALSVAREK